MLGNLGILQLPLTHTEHQVMLIQLPDGSWINPSRVDSIVAQPATMTFDGQMTPQVAIVFASGERAIVNCSSEADAETARDKIASLITTALQSQSPSPTPAAS
jgi:hypothetical protein